MRMLNKLAMVFGGMTAFNSLSFASATQQTEVEITGRWLKGDMHVHTALSADATSTLADVLTKGLTTFDLDFIAVSNHLRNNSRDNVGLEGISTLYSVASAIHELPTLQQYQQKLTDKLLISSFEWDVPTHDHMNIGMLIPLENSQQKLAQTAYFEYRFGAKNVATDFSQQQLEHFKHLGITRQNSTHNDTVAALKWLQNQYPTNAYAALNHPTRNAKSYSIRDIREFNDVAPDVFFLLEGMVGNQFNGERGDYNDSSLAGLLGGVDPIVAEVGGNWDALLGEGRHIWNIANSDHHFKTVEPYSSGYFPGEYAKTYVYVDSKNSSDINYFTWLEALKKGNSFAVYGDLINTLDFNITSENEQATMGQKLIVEPQQKITISIRVKQAKTNNFEVKVGNEQYYGSVPALHHLDIIAGDVAEKATSNTRAYGKPHNTSTQVLHSFTDQDWKVDEEGYYSMSYTMIATKDQYFRLRGTNLGYNEKGLTINGEPQRSVVIKPDKEGSQDYYQRINRRNYRDLWFYSNPIFTRLLIK
ncbi:hypothetical protein [Paraglaciecola sp.]|uniref:hypothetical protein n=1 Tax=Paraglaciecola sp. TaxID=1920173 RepID=UPI0030F40483